MTRPSAAVRLNCASAPESEVPVVNGPCQTGGMTHETADTSTDTSTATASGPATTDVPVTVTVEGEVALVMIDAAPVSYTHLTLPTILLV